MNKTGNGSFKTGDKRINRKGRPKSFDAVRQLAQQIAHKEGEQRDGSLITVVEAILKSWASSKDARLQIAFMEYAFGKVPAPVELAGKDGGPLEIVVRRGTNIHRLNRTAPSTKISDEPGKTIQHAKHGTPLGQNDFGD